MKLGLGNQYWTKERDGNDELFSDAESKIDYYKRMLNMTSSFAVLFLLYLLIFDFDINFNFYTPGLWEMEGLEFWRAFLFELPFVLVRALPVPLFIICLTASLLAYNNINKEKKNLGS